MQLKFEKDLVKGDEEKSQNGVIYRDRGGSTCWIM